MFQKFNQMTKRSMLTAVSSRNVLRILERPDISKTVLSSPGKRKNRSYKRRENKLRRKQNDCSHIYSKLSRIYSPIEHSSRVSIPGTINDETGEHRYHLLKSRNLNAADYNDCRLLIYPELICGTKLVEQPEFLSEPVKKTLSSLLSREMAYHPNSSFLYYVNPNIEDKVNASIRNEAVLNLRFLHNGYFILSPDTFCKAVNLIDRFIVKVKVKPKYISCVATASYYMAAKYNESSGEGPSAETLVQIARCGGTAADLRRMEDIISAKLGGDVDGVTALDFIRTFLGREKLALGASTLLQIALCSLEVYRYRPACLALAVLYQEGFVRTKISMKNLEKLANFCGVDWMEMEECADLVKQLYEAYYRSPLPCSRGQLVWTLSRRTRSHMVSSRITPLDTISEDSEIYEDDDLLLDRLFEA